MPDIPEPGAIPLGRQAPLAIAESSEAHAEMVRAAELGRALMSGTQGMRDEGETYLPRKVREGKRAYEVRQEGSYLDPLYEEILEEIADAPFEKPVALGDDVPAELKAWAENIDLAGRNLSVFARDVFQDGIETGLAHILADFPPAPSPRTLAESKRLSLRPWLTHYRLEDVPKWRHVTEAGKERLTRVHLVETTLEDDPDDEWGDAPVRRVRILYAAGFVPDYLSPEFAAFELWQEIEDHFELVNAGSIKPLTEIPLSTFYARRTGFMRGSPPLRKVAWLNLAHWQSSSMQRHILDWARFAILFGRLLQDDNGKPIEVGVDRIINGGNEHSDLKFVEHTGKAVEAGREDLKSLEQRARGEGKKLQTSNVTATASALDEMRESRSARAMAGNLQDALEGGFGFAAQLAGLSQGGSLAVHQEFGLNLVQRDHLDAIAKAYERGDLAPADYFEELKRRGILPDDFDSEAATERAMLEAERKAMTFSQPDEDDHEDPESEEAAE